ncbi:hypothetical protein [Fonticella tunisiensis]|uniref:Uncharacterized protein n=1 Tax=Fonticella tunisiensis TaxID=1096341 RepID=A0A4R7KSL2_9CLOT|nr:hypothetical protein [Fonticella tunisiensis]TDT62796.1 hypothetical protein EDD71_10369 [Fonticella tunisiensis]
MIREIAGDSDTRKRMFFSKMFIFFQIILLLTAIDFGISVLVDGMLINKRINLIYSIRIYNVLLWGIGVIVIKWVFYGVKKSAFKGKPVVTMRDRLTFGGLFALPVILLLVLKYMKLDNIVLFSINGLVFIFILLALTYAFRRASYR